MAKIFSTILLLTVLLPASFAAEAKISKEEAARIAQQRFEGKVIAINPTEKAEQPHYKVKILDKQGGMHVIEINAITGKVTSAH